MKTRKNILTLMLVATIAIGFGCTKDFEEINSNPNSPTLESAAPNMLLTNAIESMTDRVHNIFLGHEMGSCWAQHMAKVQYTDEDRYIPRVSVINAAWTSFNSRSGIFLPQADSIPDPRKKSALDLRASPSTVWPSRICSSTD